MVLSMILWNLGWILSSTGSSRALSNNGLGFPYQFIQPVGIFFLHTCPPAHLSNTASLATYMSKVKPLCSSTPTTSSIFLESKALKLDELMAALKKKDDDMRAMEERYKVYLEKARNVSEKMLLHSSWENMRPSFHLVFRTVPSLVGDPSTRSEAKSCHCRDSGSEGPTGRSRQADSQLGGQNLYFPSFCLSFFNPHLPALQT